MYALISDNEFVREVLPGIDFDLSNQPTNIVNVKVIEPVVRVFKKAIRNTPIFNQTSNEWFVDYQVVDLSQEELSEAIAVYNKLVSDVVQRHLNIEAQKREYDDILSLCSYRDSSNPLFAAEANVGYQWRDDVWAYCENVRKAVLSGQRDAPTADELISELPKPIWPQRV